MSRKNCAAELRGSELRGALGLDRHKRLLGLVCAGARRRVELAAVDDVVHRERAHVLERHVLVLEVEVLGAQALLHDGGERDLELQLGPKFVAELAELSTGEWVGPVDSSYGIHLVHIREKSLGRLPELEEIREDVKRGWLSERRRETT